MTLEEYIIRRKKEDGINEYDVEKRMENTRICVNYVFEYFNNYLETKPADEKTALHEQKVDKYRHQLREYDNEVKEWLVSLYSSYGKYMHKQLMNLITDDYFLLYDTEAEFRALSYDLYSKAVKKFKFLEGQSEMIFLLSKRRTELTAFSILTILIFIFQTVLMSGFKKHIKNMVLISITFVGNGLNIIIAALRFGLRDIKRRASTMISIKDTPILVILCYGIMITNKKATYSDLMICTEECRKKVL